MANPTEDQLGQALVNAHNAGDDSAARILAGAIQNMRASAAPTSPDSAAPLDDIAHAASPMQIARASLAPDQDVQIKRYAESFGQPVTDFGVVGGHVVRRVPDSGQYARVEPSVAGGTDILDTARRLGDWVAGGAGPAIPAIGSGVGAVGAGLAAIPTGPGAVAAAMFGGAAGGASAEIARQKLDQALAPANDTTKTDWGNVGWQGAAGAAGPLIGKGIEAVGSRVAPVLQNAIADELPQGATAAREAIMPGITTAYDAANSGGGRMLADQIKNAAQTAYKRVDDAGIVISPESFSSFADSLPDQLNGYHPRVTPGAANIVGMLQDEAANGPVTLSQLDKLRSVASGASVGRDPNEARLAGSIVSKIDDYVNNLTHSDIVSPEGTIGADQIQGATNALNDARNLWRANVKIQGIQDILDTAEDLNNPNIIKQKFTALVKNRSKFGQYSDEEQDLIKKIAQTGSLDALGKLAPTLDTAGMFKGAAWLAAGSANPIAATGAVGSMGAKYLAGVNRLANVGKLQDTIARGSINSLGSDLVESIGNSSGEDSANRLASFLPTPEGQQLLRSLYPTTPGTDKANSILQTMLTNAGVVGAAEAASSPDQKK